MEALALICVTITAKCKILAIHGRAFIFIETSRGFLNYDVWYCLTDVGAGSGQ